MSEPRSDTARPTVLVCAGKDCRRDQRARFDALVSHVGPTADVVTTRCLGVCAGPVVVVRTVDDAVVLRKIRSRKRRAQVLRSAVERTLVPGLADRRVEGKRRRRALARAGRATIT